MFVWADLLALAEELAGRSDETALRTSIGRSYYAAYCTVATYVLSRESGLRPLDLHHKMVWRRFKDPSNRLHWRIYQNGRALLSMRQEADYKIPMKGHTIQVQANDSLRRAREVLRDLDLVMQQQAERSASERKDDT